jgi:hypothetical protein
MRSFPILQHLDVYFAAPISIVLPSDPWPQIDNPNPKPKPNYNPNPNPKSNPNPNSKPNPNPKPKPNPNPNPNPRERFRITCKVSNDVFEGVASPYSHIIISFPSAFRIRILVSSVFMQFFRVLLGWNHNPFDRKVLVSSNNNSRFAVPITITHTLFSRNTQWTISSNQPTIIRRKSLYFVWVLLGFGHNLGLFFHDRVYRHLMALPSAYTALVLSLPCSRLINTLNWSCLHPCLVGLLAFTSF